MRIVGLDPDSKKHVGKYSLGMRQRLGIAQAIMEDPDILLLDEPLNGLDNEGVEEIRKVLLSLKEKGKLIILRYGISDGSWENYCDRDKLSRWGQKEAAEK